MCFLSLPQERNKLPGEKQKPFPQVKSQTMKLKLLAALLLEYLQKVRSPSLHHILTHSKRKSQQEAVAQKAFHDLGLAEELKNLREENKNLRVQIEQERAQHRAAIQQLQIQHRAAIQQLQIQHRAAIRQLQIQHRAAIQQLQAAIQQLQIQQQQPGPVGQGALNPAPPPQNPNGPPAGPGGAQEQQQPVVGPTGLASGPALPPQNPDGPPGPG